ncbi:unnamed protein product [Didymodactylos carnosus]|uniref:Uncharacterized protein n=1 Tax=Didymodactylos carnosus TaxID=1234261 RepID=A0A8S2GIT2_9BILA|nr:unnamed protein product [Didymodactylos carnosus]CAF3501582.1 unnamed protein product [Didymodactylos carnosus]
MQRRRGISNIRGARQSVRNMPLTVSQCFGCAQSIYDPLISNVLDRFWHPDCVKCYSCRAILSDKCYSRDGKLFCKDDFYKHFGHYCASCHGIIQSDDYIRRSKGCVYHANCFSCTKCKRLIHGGEDIFVDKTERISEHQQQHEVYLCHDCHVSMNPKILPPPPPSSSVDEEETSDSQMSNSTTSKTPVEQQQQSSSSSDIISKSDEREFSSQPVATSLQQLSLKTTNLSSPHPQTPVSTSLISPIQSQKSPIVLANGKSTVENEEQLGNVLSSPKLKNKSPTSNHHISPLRNNKSPIKAHSSSSSSSNETPKTRNHNKQYNNNSSTKSSKSSKSRTKQNSSSNNTTENNKKKPLTLSSPATRSKAAALAAATTTKVDLRNNKKRLTTRKRQRPFSDSESEEEEDDEEEEEEDMEKAEEVHHQEINGEVNDRQLQQKPSESNIIEENNTTTNTNDDSNGSSRSSSFKLLNEKQSDDEEEKELKIATPETSTVMPETLTTTATVTTSGSTTVSNTITDVTTALSASPMSISSIMKQPLPQPIDTSAIPPYLASHFPSPQSSMFGTHPMSHYPHPTQHSSFGLQFPHAMHQRPPQMLPQQQQQQPPQPVASVLQQQLSSSPISHRSHSTNASETDSLDRSLSPSQMDISTNAEASSTPARQMGSPKFNRQHNNNTSVSATPPSNPRPSPLTSLLEYGHYSAATSDNLSSQMRQNPFPFPFQMPGAGLTQSPYQNSPPMPFYRPPMTGAIPDTSGQINLSQPPPESVSLNKKPTKKQIQQQQQQQQQMLSNIDVSQNILTNQPKKKGRKLGSKNKTSKAEKTKVKLGDNEEMNLQENKSKSKEHPHPLSQMNELQKRHVNEIEDGTSDDHDVSASARGMLTTPMNQYSQLPEHLPQQVAQQSTNHQNLLTKMGLLNHQSMPPPPPPSIPTPNGNNLMMGPLMTPNGMMMPPHPYLPFNQAAFNPAFAAAAYASGYNPYPPFHPAFGHPSQPPTSQHMNFLPQNNGMSTLPMSGSTNLTEKPANDHQQNKIQKSKGAKNQQAKQQQLPSSQSKVNNININYIPSTENITVNKNSNPPTTTDSSEDEGDDDMDGKICNGKKPRQTSSTCPVGGGTDSDGSGGEMEMNLNQSGAGNSSANDSNAKKGGRTTIKAPQLEVLRRSFDVCPKPTKQQREQLAAETGLSMRVIQVWFQNKRSKERKNTPKNADDSLSSPPQTTTNTDRSLSNF